VGVVVGLVVVNGPRGVVLAAERVTQFAVNKEIVRSKLTYK